MAVLVGKCVWISGAEIWLIEDSNGLEPQDSTFTWRVCSQSDRHPSAQQ